jgi:hypothetical protein
MKHTEQDQPIHVNADRQNDGWSEDLGPDYPFGTNTSFEGWDMQTEDPGLADARKDIMRECLRDDAYAAIARYEPEWWDDEVFVDWYVDLVVAYGRSFDEARDTIDREYRLYMSIMLDEGAFEAKRDGKEEA